MNRLALATALAFSTMATAAPAAEISTHVLDLARGIGGRDVPVVLFKKADDGRWIEAGRAQTDENGRVRSFGTTNFDAGTYKLQFDMARYPSPAVTPFFPEIDLVFTVANKVGQYHVPVVVSPFGYSTYRGN